MASKRQSALASRHKALGSPLGDWNDMDAPWEYDQDINAEHRAVREAAGLFDVSGLKKVYVTGPDSLAVLNHLCTRDLTKIYPGKSVYALILDDEGGITDDCIMFHIMPNNWLMVHGGGTGREQLAKSAEGKDISIQFDDDLHDISLQGPKAVDFLNRHTPFDLPSLKYFHHVLIDLFGHHCMISRTGFSGERGYEIFASADNVVPIWDAILEQGKSDGIMACSFNCIDMIRVEAALLFYPYDMNEGHSPWELNLGFAIAKKKEADFRGKAACFAKLGKEKIKNYGVVADSDKAVELGAGVFADGERIGEVTAPMYSTVLNQSLAMVQIKPPYAKPDIKVEIKGETLSCAATTHGLPFYDPDKNKRSGD
jgi:aminomethyltransferase